MTVGGHQVEERLAIGGDFLLETFLVLAVLLHRLDTIEASSLGLVALAGEDDLAVGGLQVELILAVLPASNFKFSHIELILKLVQAANIHFFLCFVKNNGFFIAILPKVPHDNLPQQEPYCQQP